MRCTPWFRAFPTTGASKNDEQHGQKASTYPTVTEEAGEHNTKDEQVNSRKIEFAIYNAVGITLGARKEAII